MTTSVRSDGGYDDIYDASPCAWGKRPGSYVTILDEYLETWQGLKVLDLGAGEGKNSAFVAQLGAAVRSIDMSEKAIRNGKQTWTGLNSIEWKVADVREIKMEQGEFDVIIMYGLLHCLRDQDEISRIVQSAKSATRIGGYHVVCAFNDRCQDLSAHPNLEPCLLSHEEYLSFYHDWTVVRSSDASITESHPGNGISHSHSLSRLLARKEYE